MVFTLKNVQVANLNLETNLKVFMHILILHLNGTNFIVELSTCTAANTPNLKAIAGYFQDHFLCCFFLNTVLLFTLCKNHCRQKCCIWSMEFGASKWEILIPSSSHTVEVMIDYLCKKTELSSLPGTVLNYFKESVKYIIDLLID